VLWTQSLVFGWRVVGEQGKKIKSLCILVAPCDIQIRIVLQTSIHCLW